MEIIQLEFGKYFYQGSNGFQIFSKSLKYTQPLSKDETVSIKSTDSPILPKLFRPRVIQPCDLPFGFGGKRREPESDGSLNSNLMTNMFKGNGAFKKISA